MKGVAFARTDTERKEEELESKSIANILAAARRRGGSTATGGRSEGHISGGGTSGAGGGVTKLPMNVVLKHYETLNEFMQHLIKEFSIENMLVVIEFVQFRQHYARVFGIEYSSLPSLRIELPLDDPQFPKSSIVYGTAASDSDTGGGTGTGSAKNSRKSGEDGSTVRAMVSSIRALIEKYIVPGSEFEINVNYATRHQLMQVHGDVERWIRRTPVKYQLQVFDAAIKEVRRLMRDSYSRFHRNREVFGKCVHYINAVYRLDSTTTN